MPGYNYPSRPERRGACWYWGYHRSLQNLHIKEDKQGSSRQGCESGGVRVPLPSSLELQTFLVCFQESSLVPPGIEKPGAALSSAPHKPLQAGGFTCRGGNTHGVPPRLFAVHDVYLSKKKYITQADNSDFTLTALGVDFVESNRGNIPVLNRLLTAGTGASTKAGVAVSDALTPNARQSSCRLAMA
jgi:hypothetical protein